MFCLILHFFTDTLYEQHSGSSRCAVFCNKLEENKHNAVTSNSTAFLGLTTWDTGIHSVTVGSDYNRTKPYDYYCYDGYNDDSRTNTKGSIGFANDNTMHHYKIVANLDANTYSVSIDNGEATTVDSLPGGAKDGVYDSFVLTAVDRTRTTQNQKKFYADIDNLKVSVAITDTQPEPKSLECTRDGNNKVTKAQIFDKKGLFEFAKLANNGELANGVNVSLENDITFNDKEQWTPIANFKGTFDGKEHTIRNLYMMTIEDKHAKEENLPVAPSENQFAYNGFFSCVNGGSTVQNINFDGARLLAHWDDLARGGRYEYNGEKAVVAGQTKGTTTFKNITLTNCYAETYNNSVSGLISETYGDTTLSNINIDNTNYFSSLWGSYDTCVGGIIARADGNYKYNMTNCNVAAVINAVNDVCANYQWYMYRRCGMLIGCLADKGNDSYMDCFGTLSNNTVTFDAWNQYVYCEYEKNGHPAYSAPDEYKWSRINSPMLPSEGMGTRFSEEYGEPGTDKHKATHEGHQYEDLEHCGQLMAFRSIIGFCPNNSAYISIHDYPVTADTKIEGITVVDKPMLAISKSLKMVKPPVQQAVMTDASGNPVDAATKEAILNEITTNDAVNNFEETGVEQVAEQLGANAMKALLMGATDDEAVLGNIGDDTEVKSQMSVKFSNAAIDENGTVNELEFDIKPVVWAVVLGDHKQDVLVEAVIPNENIETELTVLLPIPDSVEVGTPVKILHNGEEYADAVVKLVDGNKVVELKASRSSSFKLLFGNSAEPQETTEPKWSYAWDSGKYDDNGVEKGVVRYLFGTDLADEDVQESKIVFFGENPVKDDNDKFTAKSTSGVGAFFSDLYGLDPSEPCTIYGVGCVKIDGKYIWSDIQENIFDFTKVIENYQPIQ